MASNEAQNFNLKQGNEIESNVNSIKHFTYKNSYR